MCHAHMFGGAADDPEELVSQLQQAVDALRAIGQPPAAIAATIEQWGLVKGEWEQARQVIEDRLREVGA